MSENSSSAMQLSVRNLSWSAGSKQILHDISFDLLPGQFMGLIGPNGAGKSSLMRCIYRVHRPSQGSVSVAGRDVWKSSARENARSIAVILQEHSDHMGLSVQEVVGLGLTPHKGFFQGDTLEDRATIEQAMAAVDILELRHQDFYLLSGGEKQRVMLARAIVQKPRLLIMDEPTNHLDVHYQIDVLHKVRELGISVLASFHDLNLAAAFCDQLIVLDRGRLVRQGKPASVLTEDLLGDIFQTCALIDQHPIGSHPRVSYAYER